MTFPEIGQGSLDSMAGASNTSINSTASGPLVRQTMDDWYKISILCIIIFSVPLNIGALIHCLLSKSRAANGRLLLIASMAVSDIAQAIIGYLFQYIAMAYKMTLLYCKISSFTVTFLAFVSMNHITALAIDCYLFICKPWLASKYPTLPKKLTFFNLLFAWAYALAWSMVPFIGWRGYAAVASGNCVFQWNPVQNNRRVYIISLFVFCFTIPVITIVVCFIVVQITLYKMRKYATKMCGSNSIVVEDNKKAEKKYMKMSFVIAVVFILVWTPYAVVAIFELIGYDIENKKHGKLLNDIASIIAKSSTIWNPFIYTVAKQSFRRSVRRNFARLILAVTGKKRVMTQNKRAGRETMTGEETELTTDSPKSTAM